MATVASWIRDGRPFTLCTPGRDLTAMLRGYGYPSGGYPDDRHLYANPPEDHTPFSATGWPGVSPYGVGMAIDIMPHPDSRMPSLAQLGERILADTQSAATGTQWIKYMNWTDSAGRCWHESWTPSYRRSSSTDRGHIHISCRSDLYLSGNAAGYNPVATAPNLPEDELPLPDGFEPNFNQMVGRVSAMFSDLDTAAWSGAPNPSEPNRLKQRIVALENRLNAAPVSGISEDRIRALIRDELDKTRLSV